MEWESQQEKHLGDCRRRRSPAVKQLLDDQLCQRGQNFTNAADSEE